MIARRLATALALAAVVLLVVAEFLTVLEVTVGSLEVVQRSVSGGESHRYALLAVAVVAAATTLLALRGGRAAAFGLVALGSAALAVALVVDLPDMRGSGGLPESLAYDDARARAGAALPVELAGGALLVGAGLLLLVAGPQHPGEREGRP